MIKRKQGGAAAQFRSGMSGLAASMAATDHNDVKIGVLLLQGHRFLSERPD
jgi:hypothetical protein